MEKRTSQILTISLVLLLSFVGLILFFEVRANDYLQFYFGETNAAANNISNIVSAPINNSNSPLYTSGENYYIEKANGSMKIIATCSDWGYCEGGFQKRDCTFLDVSKQLLETLDQTRVCSSCKENWRCSSSGCVNGFVESNCEDLNKCGTNYNAVSKIPCSLGAVSTNNFYDGLSRDLFIEEVSHRADRVAQNCTSNLKCDPWSACELGYNFNSFILSAKDLKGTQSRYCYDNASCVGSYTENRDCFLSLDILVKNETICGENYIKFYDKRTNKTISLLKLGNAASPSMSINLLSETSNLNCPSCTNHIRDDGEVMTDCGGNCSACVFSNKDFPDSYTLLASNYTYFILGLAGVLFAVLIFIFIRLPPEDRPFTRFVSRNPFVAEV